MYQRSYKWGWQIDSGFKAVKFNDFTRYEEDKKQYVNNYLSESVNKADCGWYGIAYVVLECDGIDRREYVLMFGDRNDTPHNARWIDVTGESKGSIAEAVWSLVFA